MPGPDSPITPVQRRRGQDHFRVLQYVSCPGIGGLERVVEILAITQHDLGRDVHVAAMLDPRYLSPPILASLAEHSIPLHVRTVSPRGYLAERRIIAGLAREIGATHIHSHGYRADLLARGAAASAGAATVSTVHGFTGGGLRNRLYERIQLGALRRFDAVVAVSAPLAELLRQRGVSSSRLRTIPNAWKPTGEVVGRAQARAELAIGEAGFVIGFVGRLSREKGADVLLEALRRLQVPGWSAVIIGDGPERTSLVERAESLGLAARIQWRPDVKRAGRLMPAFDLLVLPSRTEGTPMVLFEAIDAGIPIVATRVGGVPDVIDESSAWLASPENPAELAGGIEDVCTGDGVADRVTAARQRVGERFGPGPWIEAYDSVYQTVAKRRQPNEH